MANEYIPRGDAEFNAWPANFVTYANGHLADLGLVIGDMTPVTDAQATWKTNYRAHIAAAWGSGRECADWDYTALLASVCDFQTVCTRSPVR